jgi:hypothetical protein
MAIDMTRDVTRMHTALEALVELGDACDCAEVERALTLCLMESLKLSSARIFMVNAAEKRAKSVSGPQVSVSWQSSGPDAAQSLVGW